MAALIPPPLLHLAYGPSLVVWALILSVLASFFWSLFLDPLRHVPGPFGARWSSVWLALQCRLMRRSHAVHELHQKYGDIVRIASEHVSVNNPEAFHEIYTHDKIFPKSRWYETLKQPMPALIADMDAEDHARHRKDLQPAFSLQSIRSFELHMNKHILGLKEVLLGMFDGSEIVSLDLNPWINFQAFDIISDFVFGKPFGFVEAREDSFNLMQVMEERLTTGNAIGVLPTWIRPYLPYVPFDSFWRASLASIFRLRKLVTESYFERKAAGDVSRSDLLSFMLSAKSEDGNPLPDPRAISQSVAMVIAGSDSTAASIVHMIDFVSREKEVQDRIQKELDSAFPDALEFSWFPEDAEWEKLPYTDAVLHEVLRLRPTAATGFERVVTRPGTSFGGYSVPVGSIVSVPIYSLHHNPDVFAEPESFKPERWLGDDAAEARRHFSIFSTGPRGCIGQNFAWMEMHKTLCMLLRLFRITREAEGPTKLQEGFFLKAVECRVKLEKRPQIPNE